MPVPEAGAGKILHPKKKRRSTRSRTIGNNAKYNNSTSNVSSTTSSSSPTPPTRKRSHSSSSQGSNSDDSTDPTHSTSSSSHTDSPDEQPNAKRSKSNNSTTTTSTLSIPTFDNFAMNSTLNRQIQTGRSKKKKGRPENATLPKYNSHQVDFLHFMASPEGYMRGIYYKHPECENGYCTRNTLQMFMHCVSTGFKYKAPRKKFKRLMTKQQILDHIHTTEKVPWFVEYWKQIIKSKATFDSLQSSTSTSSTAALIYFQDDRADCGSFPTNWSGTGTHVVAAIQDMRNEHELTDTFREQYANGNHTNDLRGITVPFPALKAMQVIARARTAAFRSANPTTDVNSSKNKWSLDMLHGYGMGTHTKMILQHLSNTNLWKGQSSALVQTLTFTMSLRADNALSSTLNDLASVTPGVQIFGSQGMNEQEPTLGLLMVNERNRSDKKDIVMFLPHVDGRCCPWLALGYSFFVRFGVYSEPPPILFPSLLPSSSSSTAPPLCDWKNIMLCAGISGNRVTSYTSISTYANERAVKASLIANGVHSGGGTTKKGRHSAALILQVNDCTMSDITKQLTHTEGLTAATNYAIMPSTRATRVLAAWPKRGILSLPRRNLHKELIELDGKYNKLFQAVLPFLHVLRTQFNTFAIQEQVSVLQHEGLFLKVLIESVAGLVESLAEMQILNPTGTGEYGKLPVFNLPPFNGALFKEFVRDLGKNYGDSRSTEETIAQANQLIERGEVIEGFESLARSLKQSVDQLSSQLNIKDATISQQASQLAAQAALINQLRNGGDPLILAPAALDVVGLPEGLPAAPAVDVVEAAPILPSPVIDGKDPTSWPASPSWVDGASFQMNPAIHTMEDVREAFYDGWQDYPSIQDLDHKYGHKWKGLLKLTGAKKQDINRIKRIAACLKTDADVEKEQEQLYATFSEKERTACHSWTMLRKYLSQVIVHRSSDFDAKSAKMSGRRKKGIKKRKATAISNSSDGTPGSTAEL